MRIDGLRIVGYAIDIVFALAALVSVALLYLWATEQL